MIYVLPISRQNGNGLGALPSFPETHEVERDAAKKLQGGRKVRKRIDNGVVQKVLSSATHIMM